MARQRTVWHCTMAGHGGDYVRAGRIHNPSGEPKTDTVRLQLKSQTIRLPLDLWMTNTEAVVISAALLNVVMRQLVTHGKLGEQFDAS